MVQLEGDRDTRVEAFSKGMKMRLNFVRALLNKPEILFLDEPTAGLDPGNARIMKDIILDLQNNGATIFLTTHHMADAEELCNNIAFMVEGTLPVIDSVQNLKLQHGRKVVSVSYHENGKVTSRDFPLGRLAENKEFMETIRNREIETIHTLEASLEEIFIKVTGHHLIQ
jgi:fluoroquinolone transport system ATP-binding protein